MKDARLPYIGAALRRTYPAGLPARITASTRIRLQGGSRITLRQYCRWAWYFDVGPYAGVHGRISR